MSFVTPPLINNVLGNDPLRVVMLGGISMLLAAASVLIVRDEARRVPLGAVLEADEHTPLTTTLSAQPVPSTGLVDDEGGEHERGR
jgi:hypothetical protein